MTAEASSPAGGWPFWAPSPDGAVDGALALAGVARGDRFVDLGCGDGRVLVAAARRGAVVTGVECDAELAAAARERLAAAGLPGEVREADILDEAIDADVVFTYLSPATLQRLRPALDRLAPGTRVVTVDFPVPGVAPERAEGGAHLYLSPLRPAPRGRRRRGWPAEGALVVALPEVESLTCLEVVHPGGPVALAVHGDIADVASLATGADGAVAGDTVAVDVRWSACEAGTVAAGRLEMAGVPAFTLFVLFSEEEGGLWELNDQGCERLERCYAGGVVPAAVDDLLAVAEGEA